MKGFINSDCTAEYIKDVKKKKKSLANNTEISDEFDKANIKGNGGRYSMRGALSEMQNIIGRLSDLCNDGRKMYN